eukprot:3091787-Alexandrium_andersonii.AAC.1
MQKHISKARAYENAQHAAKEASLSGKVAAAREAAAASSASQKARAATADENHPALFQAKLPEAVRVDVQNEPTALGELAGKLSSFPEPVPYVIHCSSLQSE